MAEMLHYSALDGTFKHGDVFEPGLPTRRLSGMTAGKSSTSKGENKIAWA